MSLTTKKKIEILIINLVRGAIKRTKVLCPKSYIVQLTPNYFAVGVQFRSFSTEQVKLKIKKTPPWPSLALSFRTVSKESGKISEDLISGVNQDSFPKMMSGFAESIIV